MTQPKQVEKYWPEAWLDKWTVNAPLLYRPGERTTITERVYSPGVGCIVSRDLRFDTKAAAQAWIDSLPSQKGTNK